MRRRALAVVALAALVAVAAVVLAGSGDDDDTSSASPDDRSPAGESARRPSRHPSTREPPRSKADGARPAPLQPARCPAGLARCRTASGEIVYVERVDPDGDGDAHFVLLSRDGITGAGLSVIDVKQSLRPSPLPGPGDRLSAAGPVYRGSYGQRQIEAVEVHVARTP